MNNKRWDKLWLGGSIATMAEAAPHGLYEHAALAVSEGKIVWLGLAKDLPGEPDQLAESVYEFTGQCITPGLIDCHTHLVFGGNRSREFEMRMQGVSYTEIARAGGGILSTVKATREMNEENLFQQSVKRAQDFVAEGVTVLEIKSGYGLDLATELKMLRVAKKLAEVLPLTIKLTFLGAHALPPEYQGKTDEYIDYVCEKMLPAIKAEGLVDAVDVFCETIGFSLAQTERVFITAKKLGLPIKCHAEQLSDSGSAMLAATYQALSVDHLEYLSEKSVEALAKSGTVAVLLPGAFYYLREKKLPPIDLLRKHQVPMAISTDCNPGTSPVTSLLLMLNMACVLFGLTPEETLLGVTKHAAQALGMQDTHGTLEVGKAADFVVWDVKHPSELAYYIGRNRCVWVEKGYLF